MNLTSLTFAAFIFFFPSTATAATLHSDGSDTDTNAKTAAAASDDTAKLPATGSFTWDEKVTLPSSKWLTLDLNGRTITLTETFSILAHATGNQRVTNGSFIRGNTGAVSPYVGIVSLGDDTGMAGIRFDHISLSGPNVLVDINGRGPGVMDHCTFNGLTWAQEFIHIVGWGAENTTGWGNAVDPGSGSIFCIEDNTFNQKTNQDGVSWIQGYYGARIAIRHNTFNHISIDMHGTAGNVGARWWEGYENTFVNTVGSRNQSWAFSMRAGSGVLFNNINQLSGPENAGIGLCEEDTGYPAAYQIGRGKSSNSSAPYSSNQALDPVYVWNNTGISLSVNECDAPEQPGMVQINRDVYLSAKPGYTPYTYPHPLQVGAVDSIPPAPPTNLELVP